MPQALWKADTLSEEITFSDSLKDDLAIDVWIEERWLPGFYLFSKTEEGARKALTRWLQGEIGRLQARISELEKEG